MPCRAGFHAGMTAEQRTAKADAYRRRMSAILIHRKSIHLCPLAETEAETEALARREIGRFRDVMAGFPIMEGYFSRAHISNLFAYAAEARQAIVTLQSGLIMEVIDVPAMDQDAMGFHFFNLFDPADEADRHGRLVGYTIYSVRFASGAGNEAVAFNKAESVGVAFDIFAPYRSNRHPALRFCRHEVYNVSRSILYRRFRPAVFTVDARTQIRESRTGEPVKRAGYYLKRGYFPADCKPLADQYLAEVILLGKRLTPRQAGRLHRESNAVEWIHPVQPSPPDGPG